MHFHGAGVCSVGIVDEPRLVLVWRIPIEDPLGYISSHVMNAK